MPSPQWPPKEIAADLEPKEFKPKAGNLLTALKRRELGLPSSLNISDKPEDATVKNRIDEQFNNVVASTSELKIAVEAKNWEEIERCVYGILLRLIGSPYTESQYLSHEGKQEKELFVAFGGLQILLQLFEPHMSGTDARKISSAVMLNRSELWNEVMALLKELVYAIPSIAESYIADCHLSFMFTMLGHDRVFESTVALLEDVLTIKSDTFDLSKVPNLYALLDKLSSRQLMYFCRLLALLLFESEDRLIMESTHVLKSLDLLQIRRDRMAKMFNTVERNQCIIISMPRMLEKLILLFRVVNHGPPLSRLVRYNISQAPTDFLQYVPTIWSSDSSHKEWDMYDYLDDLTRKHERQTSQLKSSLSPSSSPSRSSHSPSSAAMSEDELENENVMDQLLTVFSPPRDNTSTMMSHILTIMQTANNLNIATVSPSEFNPYGIPAVFRRIPRSYYTYREAKNELLFQAMLLTPQQVELQFVLCTLLSGRRKVEVQRRLAELKLIDCLETMHDRLSWGSEPYVGPNPMEHIHGPTCDCNPESATRVQFLRLVHNFYDRDFIDNPIKDFLLSTAEIQMIRDHPEKLLSSKGSIPASSRGLLSKIISTYINEPYDSIYRFWLLTCLEAFLRGSNKDHQVFVAHSGVIKHVIAHISSIGVKSSTNLQTAFDLLGELMKFNLYLLGVLEGSFEDQGFRDFIDIIIANLVDSNVFLRSLYLSLEFFNSTSGEGDFRNSNHPSKNFSPNKFDDFTYATESEAKSISYLTHSWVQCHPRVISSRALEAIPANDVSGNQGIRETNKSDWSMSSSSSSKIPTSPASPHPNPAPSSLVSFGREVFNAFKGLHLAAIGYINSKETTSSDSSINDIAEKGKLSTPISSSSARAVRCNDQEDTERDELAYNGEYKGHIVGENSMSKDTDISSSISDGVDGIKLSPLPPSSNSSWSLPDSIFRISLFLSKERENILLRLMGIISIHTINHENICCLNTAIIIFILAYRKNHMSALLDHCRHLSRNHRIPAPALEDKNVTAEFPPDEIKIFSNFRKLLWYWGEYYLRRGRDRLSLEFSSHLPFKLWNTVVELLCADDGSPTALLSHPMKLPMSPYRRIARPSKCNSEFIINLTRPVLTKKSVPLDGID